MPIHRVNLPELPDADHFRNLDWIETGNSAVLALGRDYGAGLTVPLHSHTRTQLWWARQGVVLVRTAHGRWLVPPGHALLIPAGVEHSTEMISDVRMHSIYFTQSLLRAERPMVMEITPLAGTLVDALVSVESETMSERREQLIMDLLLEEIALLHERPLGLPFPREQKLALLCRQFLEAPSATANIDQWADRLGLSRRTFTRMFRNETGVSFVTWRQQACIFASLPRLADGEPITNVALDAGYENVAAFTTMFRRMLGSAPSHYLKMYQGR
ncbi:HTH-type transcriptional regulator NimR [Ensifer adhaerens]|uniref:AraC-like DNA-binding protein/mannose-6-phosphate isomerase-like protein (Cupin superfamily) n=1 Tax=Ensifer adhaerens TaxID=106592 RepID=A0ACC5SP00_ENSAD|nr:helix-turn-helix transcriptional regulator [Ensifer adhaerens]MBP1870606.1 AraC-like DNA-binding protein/mannose-6-phosphate isomerase-like protein (cupin superfamily) [Ensifer adhaerens]NRP18009.1 HTH-type transcriptional regulator NimR [Ensifer adhaerens]